MTIIQQITNISENKNNKRNNNKFSLVLNAVQMPKSSFYYKTKMSKTGRKTSNWSYKEDGEIITDKEIIKIIIELLEKDFVDYGYHKVTHILKQQGIIINKKKV